MKVDISELVPGTIYRVHDDLGWCEECRCGYDFVGRFDGKDDVDLRYKFSFGWIELLHPTFERVDPPPGGHACDSGQQPCQCLA